MLQLEHFSLSLCPQLSGMLILPLMVDTKYEGNFLAGLCGCHIQTNEYILFITSVSCPSEVERLLHLCVCGQCRENMMNGLCYCSNCLTDIRKSVKCLLQGPSSMHLSDQLNCLFCHFSSFCVSTDPSFLYRVLDRSGSHQK